MGVYVLVAFLLGAAVGGGGLYLGQKLAQVSSIAGGTGRKARVPRCFVIDPSESVAGKPTKSRGVRGKPAAVMPEPAEFSVTV